MAARWSFVLAPVNNRKSMAWATYMSNMVILDRPGFSQICEIGPVCLCNELRGIMARSTQFPNMITRSTIIYEIVSPGAAGSSIYI